MSFGLNRKDWIIIALVTAIAGAVIYVVVATPMGFFSLH